MQDVILWVGGAFLAGFIGFFGKYLGKIIIERFHSRGSDVNVGVATDPNEKKEENKYDAEKQLLKLEKKRLKLAKKQSKKQEKQGENSV